MLGKHQTIEKTGEFFLFEDDLFLVRQEAAADRAVGLLREILGLKLTLTAGTDDDGPHDDS
jgi:hypothetical protein